MLILGALTDAEGASERMPSSKAAGVLRTHVPKPCSTCGYRLCAAETYWSRSVSAKCP